jgi:hypothetical protein
MYGVENRTTVPIEVAFNVSNSQNLSFSTATGLVKKIVEPNKIEFLMHVRRELISDEIAFDYTFSHREVNEEEGFEVVK